MGDHEWLTTDEVARELRVTVRSVRRWVQEGKAGIISKQPGRRILIHKESAILKTYTHEKQIRYT